MHNKHNICIRVHQRGGVDIHRNSYTLFRVLRYKAELSPEVTVQVISMFYETQITVRFLLFAF